MDNEIILFDRLEVIKNTINKYGEENFYLSFSGGKDSVILHHLLDKALPNNQIPRVFINTGIEYNDIVKFVTELASKDSRIIMLKPSKPVKATLEQYGYPFKSKEHSCKLHEWQLGHTETNSAKKYIDPNNRYGCPKALRYQFEEGLDFKVSQYCCLKMKKAPAKEYEKKSGRSIAITGMRKEEGGQRINLGCILTDKKGRVIRFHPLAVVTEEWEDWFRERESIQLCKLYYPPFNFKRTGCKGCPFSMELEQQLEIMAMYLPAERKQCEFIWAPVYKEYRRIGYRLKNKITIFD